MYQHINRARGHLSTTVEDVGHFKDLVELELNLSTHLLGFHKVVFVSPRPEVISPQKNATLNLWPESIGSGRTV
jgi:hypothetical protein